MLPTAKHTNAAARGGEAGPSPRCTMAAAGCRPHRATVTAREQANQRHQQRGRPALTAHAYAPLAPSEAWTADVQRQATLPSTTPSVVEAAVAHSSSTKRPITDVELQDAVSMFSSMLEEYAYWVDPAWVEGTIPAELQGTYFRNGPGLQVTNPKYPRHTFDGDGMVLSMAFKDGRAFFRNKFVRTQGFVDEQIAGRPLYRNSFSRGAVEKGNLWNPLDLSFKNVANTGVIYWAGRLYALWEAGRPHELHPHSLHTVGESTVGGSMKGGQLAGHYRLTAEADGSQRWVTFGTGVTLAGSAVTFYEYAASGEQLHASTHQISGLDICFIHDMLVTEHWYVLVMGPMRFEMGAFLTQYVTGRCSIAECLRYDPDLSTKVLLFPRPGRPGCEGYAPLQPRTLETVPFFSFHHINAYEAPPALPSASSSSAPATVHSSSSSSGGLAGILTTLGSLGAAAAGNGAAPLPPHPAEQARLVIDTIGWADVKLDRVNHTAVTTDHYTGGCRPHYHRLVADLGTGRVSSRQLLRRTVEFPALNPAANGRPHRHSYLVADMVDDTLLWAPGQAILKVTVPPEKGVGQPLQLSLQDVATEFWHAGPRSYPGEPVFIPRQQQEQQQLRKGGCGGGDAEGSSDTSSSTSNGCTDRGVGLGATCTDNDDGWLLTVVHNADTRHAEIVVLDAGKISEGPVCRITLPHHLSAGLHGMWAPTYLGPEWRGDEEAEHSRRQQPTTIQQL